MRTSRVVGALVSIAVLVAGNVQGGSWQTIDLDNRQSEVYVPRCANASTPIVLSLHGLGVTVEITKKFDQFFKYADERCAIVVYPQGLLKGWGPFSGAYSWNAGGCCPNDNAKFENGSKGSVDDVAYLARLIDAVADKWPANRHLVFAVGISNGGMMSNRLACEVPAVKGIVSIAGPLINGTGSEAFACDRRVPILHMHGTADQIVPYGGCSASQGVKDPVCSTLQHMPNMHSFPSVVDYISDWRHRNGASDQGHTTFQNRSVTCESWGTDISNNVTLCTITGMGHAWPGFYWRMMCDIPLFTCTNDIQASSAAWDFFQSIVASQIPASEKVASSHLPGLSIQI